MVRVNAALVAGLVLVLPLLAGADSPLDGTYKVVIPTEKGSSIPWLIKLESKDGKWTGKVLATGDENLEGSAVEDVVVGKELFGFKIKTKRLEIRFEGKVPKDKEAKVPLSLVARGDISPAILEATTLTSLDRFEVARDLVAKQNGGHEVVQTALELLANATMLKAKPEEVRAWADKAARGAEAYGPLWHREIIIDIADLLSQQEGFANVALSYARRAETLLDEAKDAPLVKKKVLSALATALEKTGKADEAKEVQARNNKIPYITPKKFAGRTAKSDRVVLVELFTSTQAPNCVAVALACAALEQTYKPSEVVLLQYHLNRGEADPLANPDDVERAKFYDNLRGGVPAVFFGGRSLGKLPAVEATASQEIHDRFTDILGKLLEEKAKGSIKLSATRKGAKIDIKADVADLSDTGPDIRLRLVLVEEKVDFTGANKLPVHHCVVRAFPGGTAGTVLKDKTATKTVSIDLDELRKNLTEYLEKNAKDEKLPNKDRLLELKKLRVVAFVQNNDTNEVMQAAQVEVTAGE